VCSGDVEAIGQVSETELLTGWAWDDTSRQAARGIVFANQDGIIMGNGVVGLPRGDKKEAVRRVTSANVGWHRFVRVPDGPTEIRSYAVLSDDKTICEIHGAVVLNGPRGTPGGLPGRIERLIAIC
jgi:hypothetical protein